MNLRQLQYLREIARQGMSISAAAKALETSQPAISKQLRLLEDELGAPILLRSRNKVTGLTAFGESILPVVLRIVSDVGLLEEAGGAVGRQGAGSLTLATTQTYAQYVLPPVMQRFLKRHPKVRLVQRLAKGPQIPGLIASGEVDIGVTTGFQDLPPTLVSLACRKMPRVVVVPQGHELVRRRPTLQKLAQYPFIARNAEGGVMPVFRKARLSPHIALTIGDVDALKACVAQDFGISVLLEAAYDPKRDAALQAIPAGHLFNPAVMSVLLQRRKVFRPYLYDFIEMLQPKWNRARVDGAIAGSRPAGKSARVD